ncbi:zinc finger protein 836 [Folsomia candida]|uniref:C2H2-type domain-containing protein n=1 Tax=Folsomia candida TaxID=158441 RepID=A0A226DJL5_FOLCA|nr:zinc finger protein 836 [Folsomia candida]XP_035713802.1 zinc finger protein 836 [Folsomia candida]OXA45310.1 hypothetical protein Fcan01_20237 [Folsomia candida]
MKDSGTQSNHDGRIKRKFRCEHSSCGKLFTRKEHLDVHFTTHSSLRPYSCPICRKTFKHKNALATHIKIHNEEQPHLCGFPNCGKSFRSLRGLRLHEKLHGDPDAYKVFQCPSCPKRFGRRARLKGHEESVHLKLKPFRCPLCPKYFGTPSQVKNHLSQFHLKEKPLKCDQCGKECGTKTALDSHRETHKSLNDRKLYPCKVPRCGRIFRHEGTLKGHEKLVHEGLGFTCGVANCGKKFATRSYLRQHEAAHSLQKECICTKCGKMLGSLNKLERHDKIVHGTRYRCKVAKCRLDFCSVSRLRRHEVTHVARLECYFCHKFFKWNQGIENHLRVHTLERPFSCKVPHCGFASGQKSNLTSHEWTHDKGGATLQCASCPKKFLTRYSLTTHENRVHLKLKPFTCKLCGKGCGDPGGLKIHISGFHLQEKPHKCGDCGAEFTVKCSLDKHWESRHAESRKVFECRECGRTWLTVASLKEHMEGEHGQGEEFPCGFTGCGKVAKTLKALKRHEATHSSREVTCSECGKMYASRGSLSEHVKRVHF